LYLISFIVPGGKRRFMPRGPDPKHSDEDLLQLFVENPDPVYFVTELAAELDMSEEGVRQRIESLVEDGRLLSKKPGSRTRVYWISREGKQWLREQRQGSGNQ
jgi:predicted ArsR family transcriptional regulator